MVVGGITVPNWASAAGWFFLGCLGTFAMGVVVNLSTPKIASILGAAPRRLVGITFRGIKEAFQDELDALDHPQTITLTFLQMALTALFSLMMFALLMIIEPRVHYCMLTKAIPVVGTLSGILFQRAQNYANLWKRRLRNAQVTRAAYQGEIAKIDALLERVSRAKS